MRLEIRASDRKIKKRIIVATIWSFKLHHLTCNTHTKLETSSVVRVKRDSQNNLNIMPTRTLGERVSPLKVFGDSLYFTISFTK